MIELQGQLGTQDMLPTIHAHPDDIAKALTALALAEISKDDRTLVLQLARQQLAAERTRSIHWAL